MTFFSETESSLYQTLFQRHCSPMLLVNPDTLQLWQANQAALAFYGYEQSQLLKMNLISLGVKNQQEFEAHLSKIRSERDHTWISRHQLADGSLKDVQVHGSLIQFQQQNVLFLLVHDLSPQLETERELRAVASNQYTLIENTDDLIWSVDYRMRLLVANPSFHNYYHMMLGRRLQPGDALLEGIPSDLRDFWAKCYQRALNGDSYSMELPYMHQNKLYVFDLSFNPIRNDNNDITGVAMFARDITERKTQEDELIRAKLMAEEGSRTKSQFLANVSHEVRTPLNGIIGFASVLEEELADGMHLEYASRISRGANRLLNTINDILDLSRLEASKQELNFEDVDLVHECRSIASLLEPMVRGKDLRIIVEAQVESIYTHVDSNALSKILNNIVGNAIKFTEQGSVIIQISKVPDLKRGPQAQVCVIDTGVGIDPSFLPNIFHEFQQESRGYSRNYEGSGLGLTITKKLIELLNGTIQIQSIKHQGTTITVTLPLASHQVPVQELPKMASKDRLKSFSRDRKCRMLLVEDDEDSQLVAQVYLKNQAFLDLAANSEQAVALASSNQYDVIFMDINLGAGPDGIQTASLIRQLPNFNGCPLVAVTAYTMKGDSERFIKAGFDGYLDKPYQKEKLLQVLYEHCSVNS